MGNGMNPDGYYKTLPMQDYLTDPALSKSGLSDLAISPAHYKARKLEPRKFAAADLGSATHMLILEPELAEKQIITPPSTVLGKNGSRNTNAYREWASNLDEGTIVLSADEMDAAQYMRDAVIAHPAASELLADGFSEVSMFWTDSNGIRRKCRPDKLNGAYIDLKTARSAKPEWFGKQAHDLHYHWSAFWTVEIGRGLGSGVLPYYFVAVEKEIPWAVCVFETPQRDLDLAESEITPVYHAYRACTEHEIWPAYSDQIETLKLPAWAYKKEKRED